MAENRKMEMLTPFFLKEEDHRKWIWNTLFASLGCVNQKNTWSLESYGWIPVNFGVLEKNEWDFWAILVPLLHKEEKRYGEEGGTLKSEVGRTSIISPDLGDSWYLLKVIKGNWKWMNIIPLFLIFFGYTKKN